VENIPAISHRVDALEEFDNDLLDDTPEPWQAQAYTTGDVVSHRGRFWVALQDQAADKEPGGTAPLTFWLSLALERTARIANEAQYLLDAIVGAPINGWQAKDYPAGSFVDHHAKLYGSTGPATAADVPGVAAVWAEQSLVLMEQRLKALEASP
jgi:hypothetical protein